MSDLGSYRVPREAELGREIRMDQRRSANRTALLALGGILVLCVCMCLGVGVLATATGNNPFITADLGLDSLFASATATPRASARGTPTLVPYGKGGKSDNGLRVTVTAYQRPLPTEDVEIPDEQELVLVTVRIENTRTTGAPIKFSPDDFALVSPDGDRFNVNIGGITTGENLKDGELSPGKTAKGDLIFFVYSDAADLQLAWTSADGKTRLFRLTR
ncbi:MAG: DUF4352 domain-containing protein [Chloroflexi bacterium]|nr:DUF4352 domain-containing protein [Chloroflexota bacterium]